MSTVRELVDRSTKWVVTLPEVDSRFAEAISTKMLSELARIEERVVGRVDAMEQFSRHLKEVTEHITTEETWLREFTPNRDFSFKKGPNTLAEKRDLARHLEIKLEEIDRHIESVKRLSEEPDLPASSGECAFVLPPELTSRLQNLRQSLVLQRQTVTNQRQRWIQAGDQHAAFVANLYSACDHANLLAIEVQKYWVTFQDVCKDKSSSLDMISWTKEAVLQRDELVKLSETVKQLNHQFPSVRATTGCDRQSRLDAELDALR
uniref:Uncharacterized protein n=1 Tax=Mesocestoides corti TaxID=53468 RepID=A0A5K3FHA4_MESCO